MAVEVEWNDEARALVLPFRGEHRGRPSPKAADKLAVDAAKKPDLIEAEVRAGERYAGRVGRELYERVVDGWMKGQPPREFDRKLEIAGAQVVVTLHQLRRASRQDGEGLRGDPRSLGGALRPAAHDRARVGSRSLPPRPLPGCERAARDRARVPRGRRAAGRVRSAGVPSGADPRPLRRHHDVQTSFWTHLRYWLAAADEGEHAEAVKVAERLREHALANGHTSPLHYVTEGLALAFLHEERFWRPYCEPLETPMHRGCRVASRRAPPSRVASIAPASRRSPLPGERPRRAPRRPPTHRWDASIARRRRRVARRVVSSQCGVPFGATKPGWGDPPGFVVRSRFALGARATASRTPSFMAASWRRSHFPACGTARVEEAQEWHGHQCGDDRHEDEHGEQGR